LCFLGPQTTYGWWSKNTEGAVRSQSHRLQERVSRAKGTNPYKGPILRRAPRIEERGKPWSLSKKIPLKKGMNEKVLQYKTLEILLKLLENQRLSMTLGGSAASNFLLSGGAETKRRRYIWSDTHLQWGSARDTTEG